MKIILFFMFVIFSFSSFSKGMGRLYFKNFLGHVHKNPLATSASKTIVQCSHSVKILHSPRNVKGWKYVQVGEDKGYIKSSALVSKRPKCLQQKYPKFYNSLNLDISEMYYWGRLYDHYTREQSRIR